MAKRKPVRRRDIVIKVRVTERERADIAWAAYEAEMSVSEFMRVAAKKMKEAGCG